MQKPKSFLPLQPYQTTLLSASVQAFPTAGAGDSISSQG